MTEKYYDLDLPYYKRGDDLHAAMCHVAAQMRGLPHAWDDGGKCLVTNEEVYAAPAERALVVHAEMLEAGARQLREVAGFAVEHGLRIAGADTHMIQVLVDTETGERMVEAGLISHDPHEEDLETDDEVDEDDDAEDEDDDDWEDDDDDLDDDDLDDDDDDDADDADEADDADSASLN